MKILRASPQIAKLVPHSIFPSQRAASSVKGFASSDLTCDIPQACCNPATSVPKQLCSGWSGQGATLPSFVSWQDVGSVVLSGHPWCLLRGWPPSSVSSWLCAHQALCLRLHSDISW